MNKYKITLLFVLFFLCSCKTKNYKSLLTNAQELDWIKNIEDANKAIELAEEAINLFPQKWDAYFLELNIYSIWGHRVQEGTYNYENIKSVYDRWLSMGNDLTVIQKFAYANTLYCLEKFDEAYNLYKEVNESFENGSIDFTKDEASYVFWIFSRMMLYDLDEEELNKIKLKRYETNEVNEYLLEEIRDFHIYDKKQFAERFCVIN